jgi:hypothetical protein
MSRMAAFSSPWSSIGALAMVQVSVVRDA